MLAQVCRVVVVLLAVAASGCATIAHLEPDVRAIRAANGDVILVLADDTELARAERRGPIYVKVWNESDPELKGAARGSPGAANAIWAFDDDARYVIAFFHRREERLSWAATMAARGVARRAGIDAGSLERVGLDPAGEYRFDVIPKWWIDPVLASGPGPLVVCFTFHQYDLRPLFTSDESWRVSRTMPVQIDPALLPPAPLTSQPPE
jgi:hypothetical protein